MAKPGSITAKINERVQLDFRDLEIEYQLMAYLIRVHPQSCTLVHKSWFSDGVLRDIFTVIDKVRVVPSKAALFRDIKKADLIDDEEIVRDVLKDLYKVDLESIEERGAQHLMDQVVDLYDSRRMLEGIAGIIGSLKKFNREKAKQILKHLSSPVTVANSRDEGYYLENYDQRLEIMGLREERAAEAEEGSVGIPTGILQFDRLCGGILPKEFGVIAGTTGVGKTAGIVNFGIHAWMMGHNCLIVSGEMAKEELQFRIDMNLAAISGRKFRNAELEEDDYAKWDATIKRYTAMYGDNILYTVALHRNFTTDHIEEIIIRLQDDTGEKIEWLGIDYLNIMESTRSSSSDNSRDWASQANVVWDVKGLTDEYNLVTWTCNQVKDEAFEKERFELSDLKYARAISEAAPVVVAFIRTDDDILHDKMRYQVLKMRNAMTPKRQFVIYPNMDIMRINIGQKTGVKSLTDYDDKVVRTRKKKYTPPKKDVRTKTMK